MLLWFAAISAGIMAGVYFTFSAFVMRSLDALEKPAGIAAMQSINRVILKSPFLPRFFASTAACAVLAVMGLMQWGAPGAWQAVSGAALYLTGMFGVTVAGNVPLNNTLEATAPDTPEAAAMWRRYMREWLPWNHARTVSCTVSLALLVWALVTRG